MQREYSSHFIRFTHLIEVAWTSELLWQSPGSVEHDTHVVLPSVGYFTETVWKVTLITNICKVTLLYKEFEPHLT